jgi:hypothetical protein
MSGKMPPGMMAAIATGAMKLDMDGPGGAKYELAALVRNIELLTGDIALTLTAAQATAVNDYLRGVEAPAKMSNDDAKARHDNLLALLNDDQKARLESIGFPRPGAWANGSGGMIGMGGRMLWISVREQDEDRNPFQQEAAAKVLKNLRERLAKVNAAKLAARPADTTTPSATFAASAARSLNSAPSKDADTMRPKKP